MSCSSGFAAMRGGSPASQPSSAVRTADSSCLRPLPLFPHPFRFCSLLARSWQGPRRARSPQCASGEAVGQMVTNAWQHKLRQAAKQGCIVCGTRSCGRQAGPGRQHPSALAPEPFLLTLHGLTPPHLTPCPCPQPLRQLWVCGQRVWAGGPLQHAVGHAPRLLLPRPQGEPILGWLAQAVGGCCAWRCLAESRLPLGLQRAAPAGQAVEEQSSKSGTHVASPGQPGQGCTLAQPTLSDTHRPALPCPQPCVCRSWRRPSRRAARECPLPRSSWTARG